ncbi:hypothetical protein ABZP36_000863 [Zizania latifolia]
MSMGLEKFLKQIKDVTEFWHVITHTFTFEELFLPRFMNRPGLLVRFMLSSGMQYVQNTRFSIVQFGRGLRSVKLLFVDQRSCSCIHCAATLCCVQPSDDANLA